MDKLKVSNMIITGRICFNRKLSLDEINKLIEEFNWASINELNPLLSKNFPINNHNPFVSLNVSGSIYMSGIKSINEAKKIREQVLNELKEVCPKVLSL